LNLFANRQRGGGRLAMVSVSGNTAFVKDQEEICPYAFAYSLDVSGQQTQRLNAQGTIRELEQFDLIGAKFDSSVSEFPSADPAELGSVRAKRRRFAESKAERGR
jgi:hypothetical protein